MADKTSKIKEINHKHKLLSKIFKRALALFIIVIINFNSFSAVVSSNDGSAFITKAEFDALVNDFNSRIEDYEKSIDAKIDGAIAEYLAGLATSSSINLKSLIEILSEENKTFSNANWNNYNASNTVAGDVGIQIIRLRGFFSTTLYDYADRWGMFSRILLNGGTSYTMSNNYRSNNNIGWWTEIKYDSNGGYYYVEKKYQTREIMSYRATNGYYASQNLNEADLTWNDGLDETGSVFYCNNTSPVPVLKGYQAKISSDTTDYLSSLSASYINGSASANYCGNLSKQCFNQLSTSSYWFMDGDLINNFDDTILLSFNDSCYRREAIIYKRTTDRKISETHSWVMNETDVTLSSNSTKKRNLPLTSIKNHTLSNVTGEVVDLFGGLPMCNLIGSPGKLTFKLELSEDAVVCINYGQFGNTEVTTATTNCDKNYGTLTRGTHNLTLDLSEDKWAGRKDILWLKVNRVNSSVSEIKVNVQDIFIEVEM